MEERSRKAEIERKLREALSEAKVAQDGGERPPLQQFVVGNNNVQIAGNLKIVADLPMGANLIPCPGCKRPVSGMPGSHCPACGCAVGDYVREQKQRELDSRLGIAALASLVAVIIGMNMRGVHWLPDFLHGVGNYLLFGGAGLLFLFTSAMYRKEK